MERKRKQKIPSQLLAARKGNRDAEFEMFGPGFHQKEHTVDNKKKYNRKKQPKVDLEDLNNDNND